MFLGVVTVYLALCVALGWALIKVGIRPFERLVFVCRKLGFRVPTCAIIGLLLVGGFFGRRAGFTIAKYPDIYVFFL